MSTPREGSGDPGLDAIFAEIDRHNAEVSRYYRERRAAKGAPAPSDAKQGAEKIRHRTRRRHRHSAGTSRAAALREDQVARLLEEDTRRLVEVFQAEEQAGFYWATALRRAALRLEEADGIRRTDLGLPLAELAPMRWLSGADKLLGEESGGLPLGDLMARVEPKNAEDLPKPYAEDPRFVGRPNSKDLRFPADLGGSLDAAES